MDLEILFICIISLAYIVGTVLNLVLLTGDFLTFYGNKSEGKSVSARFAFSTLSILVIIILSTLSFLIFKDVVDMTSSKKKMKWR